MLDSSNIHRVYAGAVRCEALRPDDWQEIWPELAEPLTTAPVKEAA